MARQDWTEDRECFPCRGYHGCWKKRTRPVRPADAELENSSQASCLLGAVSRSRTRTLVGLAMRSKCREEPGAASSAAEMNVRDSFDSEVTRFFVCERRCSSRLACSLRSTSRILSSSIPFGGCRLRQDRHNDTSVSNCYREVRPSNRAMLACTEIVDARWGEGTDQSSTSHVIPSLQPEANASCSGPVGSA